MRIVLFIMAVLSLFSVSCRKNKTPEPEEPAPVLTGMLKQLIIDSNGRKQQFDYAYLDSTTLHSITYTADNKTMKEYFEYKNDTLRFSYKGDTVRSYFYSIYGRLSEVRTRYDNNPDNYLKSRFLYYTPVPNLYIIERRAFASKITEGGGTSYSDDFVAEVSFYWNGSNVSGMTENLGSWVIVDTKYTYGDTKDPLYDLYHKVLRIKPDGSTGLSPNNLTEINAITHGFNYKVNGVYNDRGYPIKKTILREEKGNWIVHSDYSYEYYE